MAARLGVSVLVMCLAVMTCDAAISVFEVKDWDTVATDGLPIGLTAEEAARQKSSPPRKFSERDQDISYKMGEKASVTMVAEYEFMSHVLVVYPLGIPASLVANFSSYISVICIVEESLQSRAADTFQNAGAVMSNITYFNARTDSYWIRDYGPWWVRDGSGVLSIHDFEYNRPRPDDDKVAKQLSDYFGVGYEHTTLKTTGGNMMTDGTHMAASTTLVYEENSSMSKKRVNSIMEMMWGINKYLTVKDPTGDYIEHIDCWGKLLNETTILVDSFPTSNPHSKDLDAVADYYASQTNGKGEPLNVVRVFSDGSKAYSNSLILNGKAFVPISSADDDLDMKALKVYQDAMPGYDIIGVTAKPGAPWENTDALHCRTRGVPYPVQPKAGGAASTLIA